MKLIGFVPLPSLWDTIYPFSGDDPDNVTNRHYDQKIPVRPLYAWFCKHTRIWNYIRVNDRAGPGSFADNFQGKCCADCGKIVEEVQTL